jgi:hypothetical protein
VTLRREGTGSGGVLDWHGSAFRVRGEGEPWRIERQPSTAVEQLLGLPQVRIEAGDKVGRPVWPESMFQHPKLPKAKRTHALPGKLGRVTLFG